MFGPGVDSVSSPARVRSDLGPSAPEAADWLGPPAPKDRSGHRFHRVRTGNPLSHGTAGAPGRLSGKDIGAMSLFTKLFEAVHSWRRRRDGVKSRRHAGPAMEQLDHRQLMAVNFTGVVANDFPATQVPGVVVIPSPPDNQR